jgi:hypothetical protein
VDLAAEREQQLKEQFDKLVNQTVYDFRQAVSGNKGGKANRGNKRNNQANKGKT